MSVKLLQKYLLSYSLFLEFFMALFHKAYSALVRMESSIHAMDQEQHI